MKFFLTIILILVAFLLPAQDLVIETAITDLLKRMPELIKSDKAAAHDQLAQAIRQTTINGNYKIGQLYYWTGELFLSQAQYDSAGHYMQLALPWLEKENDEPILGRAYIGAGYIMNYQSKFVEAFAYDRKAEKIFRKLNDRKMLARTLKRMGDDVYYQDEAHLTQALPYYQESITIAESEKDTLNIIRGLNAIVSIYTDTRQFKKVGPLMEQAILLAEKINCLRCMAISYSQWGINEHKSGNYLAAIEKYQKEGQVNEQMGSEYDQFFVYQNIAEALIGLKRFDEALSYSDRSMKIALSGDSWKHQHDAYKARYQALKGKGDVAGALLAYEKQMQYRDSLFSEEKEKIMGDLRAAYDLERKEAQIEDLKNQNLIQELEAQTARQWQYGLIIFLILLATLMGVLYNRYQLKQRTAKTLDEKNNELQKLNGFKDRMFAVISHDLRNPVEAFNTLIGSLHQNLQHASHEEVQDFLATALQSAKDLKSLLNNLLEWSLVQIGKLPFNPQPVNLSNLIRESASHVETMATAKKINIHHQLGSETVLADVSMLTIVMRNLLSNAIKYSHEGKNIHLQAQRSNGSVTISVTDEGIGMKTEDVGKLFKMEESTHAIGNSPEKGAGIGLLLSKELVERNRGRIWAESEPGKGSTFLVELPAA